MEKINDAVSLIGINSGYKGQLFGRSLGVNRVNDLVYTGWNESANVYSLPFLPFLHQQ